MNRYMKYMVSAAVIFCFYAASANADIYALKDAYYTNHIADELNGRLTYQEYNPVYSIPVTASAGDILRLSGQIEVSEEEMERNRIWAYLSIRPSSSQTRARVSSYAYQIAAKESNHHMPLNLYGYYAVPTSGDYIVEIMARHYSSYSSSASQVDIEGCCGHIIVEQYRPYPSVQEISEGAMLLVDSDHIPFDSLGSNVEISAMEEKYFSVTRPFALDAGDILRAQGSATGTYNDGDSFFGLHLKVHAADEDAQLAVSTENITSTLYRFTAQNDGMYVAAVPKSVNLTQGVQGRSTHSYFLVDRENDLFGMQFSSRISDRSVSYLLGSQNVVTSTTTNFHTNDPAITLLTASGLHQVGDIFRVNSQLQLEIVDGYGAAACWASIKIYENGVQKYDSMRDQRYMRNFADSSDPDFHLKDHQYGLLTPFAFYTATASGSYQIKLVSDCSSSAGVTMEAVANGRHLNIDQFRKAN